MAGILDGIRVLDFGRYIAGPYCAALLADMGADVIRVERLSGGEDRYVTPVTDDGTGSMFMQCNRNKRGMTLNPTKPEGREVTAKLVASADVVVANLPPQTLRSVGLDYDTLKAIKPDIILATVTAFGQGGPWSNKVGFDGLAQSMSGNLHMSGTADTPTRSFGPYVDYCTASLTAMSTVGALFHRLRTGEGQLVEGALLKTALTVMNGTLIEQHHLQLDRVGLLNRAPTSGPADVFATEDGWLMCLVIGRPQFERWAGMVGAADLLADPRFTDDIGRGNHGEILSARMQEWCSTRSTAAALEEMDQHKVPGGPVYSPQQTLDDEHVNAIGFFEDVQYPSAAQASPLSGFPVSLSKTPGVVHSPAPTLSQHTDEILHELGYSGTDIEALRGARIV
jgi:crotonobetainyl-CoA:carnitine CoA-transferase CaiB-like acyl-CoA transferase